MYQKVMIIGNLGTDPELRYTPQGDAVTSFSVATNRKWTGKDGQPAEETTWFRISVWGSQAESCNQYLSKGRQVFVEGTLTPDKETGGPRIWTTNDGTARSGYDLRAYQVKFLGGGQQQQEGEQAQARTSEPASNVPADEIPF